MMLTFLNCDVVRRAALHGGRRNARMNFERDQMGTAGYGMRLIEGAALGVSGPVTLGHLTTSNDCSFDVGWER
jgi:hypothetical protein